ncbi:hypothetical protein AVEN_269152-1 [Araneus ventricosus]|uniref:Uncharacterized protein n=1 Tax=Araneus ventricosus TaxID=182803 RepID=A0A4Y2U6S2_ARAVE|nr:hypothetical protein AVEN_269152-1 [Araneus ventricosus]
MAVLPPLEQTVLQSRESDADAEMSSSSASEEDALEYNMSEDLEDSPAAISPPPPSKPEKANKYRNSGLPQIPDLRLHPSEEDEDLQMNCEVSASPTCVPPSQTPNLP